MKTFILNPATNNRFESAVSSPPNEKVYAENQRNGQGISDKKVDCGVGQSGTVSHGSLQVVVDYEELDMRKELK